MRTAATFVLFLMMASIAWGQQQPLPKPVTPKVPIPGSTPPSEPGKTKGADLPAGNAQPGADSVFTISSFLDGQTIAVVRIDLADLDLGAIQQWVLGAVDELRKTNKEIIRAQEDVNQELGQAFGAVEKFRSAGAKQVYVVASLADLTEGRPPIVVVPLESGTDPRALQAMVAPPTSRPVDRAQATAPQAQVVRGAVVFAAPQSIARLWSLHSAARPDVNQAFSSAGKGHLHVAFVPQEQARKQFENAVPTLPEELGGGPIGPVSRGIQWGELTLELPPSPALHMIIQSKDADSAKSLEQIVDKGIAFLNGAKNGPPEMNAWKGLLSELRPKVEGDRLVTNLTGDQTRQLAGVVAANFLYARNMAKRIEAANHLRQLWTAVMMYATENKNRLPKALGDEVKRYLPNLPGVYVDPLRPNQKKPYVYVRLADWFSQIKDPAHSILIYENHTTWDDGINVEFADGHGEWVASESEFRRMLDQTKQQNPGATEMPQ